jgi:hypothetical protein
MRSKIKFEIDAYDHVEIPIVYDPTDFESDAVMPDDGPILIKSPCALRPDTLRPCELLKKSKDNSVCYNCGLRQGRPANNLAEERQIEIARQEAPLTPGRRRKDAPAPFYQLMCAEPGCTTPAIGPHFEKCERHEED